MEKNKRLEIILRGGPGSGKSVVQAMIHYLLKSLTSYTITIEDGSKKPEDIVMTERKVLFTKDMCGEDKTQFFKGISVHLKTEEADV
jgi:Tfp pilus assembly ATPase PilU